MAIDSDLSQFFDTADFAVAAEIRNASGAFVRKADVILNTPTQVAQVFDADAVAVSSPYAQGRSADFADVRDGWKVKIAGVTYRVSGPPFDDGTGVVTVYLKP